MSYVYIQNFINNTCLECNYQYQLLDSNQCKQQQLNCGDGLLQGQEECDDENYQANDGCKDCLVEQNWICITRTIDKPSQCAFNKAPNLIINYLNMTENKQYVSIQFDQQVKIKTAQPLSETMNFQLSNINKNKWNSSLFILQDVGSDVSFGEFIVQIEIQQLLELRPVLKISINQPVIIAKQKQQIQLYQNFFQKKILLYFNDNLDNAALLEIEKSITLQYPTFLNEIQTEYSENFKTLNQILIYFLFGIAGVSLIFGNGDLFIEILAILGYEQYLRQG